MREFANANLSKGQRFRKDDAVKWFGVHYPRIQPATVGMHVEAMSVNSRLRKHHPTVRPGSEHDLFFKLGPGQYRLYEPDKDPAPIYKTDLMGNRTLQESEPDPQEEISDEEEASEGSKEFAFERDLRNYLLKSLGLIGAL